MKPLAEAKHITLFTKLEMMLGHSKDGGALIIGHCLPLKIKDDDFVEFCKRFNAAFNQQDKSQQELALQTIEVLKSLRELCKSPEIEKEVTTFIKSIIQRKAVKSYVEQTIDKYGKKSNSEIRGK